MQNLRNIRNAIKRFDVPLFFVTAILGAYLAVANILRAAKWPDESTWAPGRAWFWAIVGSAVWVPLYALYKALDAHFAKADEAAVKLERDLALVCQETVAAIAHHCEKKKVSVNDLAAQVWICKDDGSFDRRARFYLPHERPSSGIVWRKGKGVAGMAWRAGRHLRADLRPIYARLDELGSAEFDKLPPDERLGMSALELSNSRDYKGICAIRLFSPKSTPEPLAIFVIDYSGDEGFDCVIEASNVYPVSSYIGGCQKTLTEAEAFL